MEKSMEENKSFNHPAEKEAVESAAAHGSAHRGRYNMDFEKETGDPYGNMEKAREHIRGLKA